MAWTPIGNSNSIIKPEKHSDLTFIGGPLQQARINAPRDPLSSLDESNDEPEGGSARKPCCRFNCTRAGSSHWAWHSLFFSPSVAQEFSQQFYNRVHCDR